MPENLFSQTDSARLNRTDKRAVLLLTLIFTIFTLLNLGTLSFPQTVWTASDGESLTLDLGETQEIGSIVFNGNIADGKLLVTSDNGQYYEYQQVFGEMFSWREKTVGFSSRFLNLTVLGGKVSLNEIAVKDAEGNVLPVAALSSEGYPLVDEQDTVPAEPGYMNGMYFDEIYHARTAYEFLHGMSVYEWTHPPLGKAIIALGIMVFGMCPFGWRVMPALFGAAMLPLMYLLGKRLFRRSDLAFLGAALFTLDTMHYAQTRIATVDVFIVFFILLMYLFMTDYLQMDFYETPLKKQFLPLGACGISFGLGVASKWTGLYAGAGLALLFFGNLLLQAPRAKSEPEKKSAFWRRTWKTVFFCCIFFVVIPALIYYLSYIPFYRYEASHSPSSYYGLRDSIRTLLAQQQSMFSYHSGLTATHLCQSAWYQWPFTDKSVWFYSHYDELRDRFSEIVTIGSPAVWWVAASGTLCLATEGVFGGFRRNGREKRTSFFILLVAIAANYFPWMLVTRCTFAYHFFPTLPFMILSAVLLIQKLEEEKSLPGWIKWAWLGVAFVYFCLMLPGVSGISMSRKYAAFLEYVLPCGYLFYGSV